MSHYRVRGWAVLLSYVVVLALALARTGDEKGRGFSSPRALAGGEGAIAVVDIRGGIGMGSTFHEGGVEDILRRLRDLRDRGDVKAVLLRIDSPGGTVGSVQEIYDAVKSLRAAGKKVVATVGDLAASGGYYVAVASDRVVVNPGSLVGSIGVVFHLMNAEDLAKKAGLRMTTIKSGALKDMGSPYRELTPEERRVFESLVASAYGQFLRAVSEGRKIPEQKLRPLADGRVFTGEQALALGLVDVLGGYDTAVQEAARLAGIKSAHPRVLDSAKPWEKLLGAFGTWSPWTEIRSRLSGDRRLAYVWE